VFWLDATFMKLDAERRAVVLGRFIKELSPPAFSHSIEKRGIPSNAFASGDNIYLTIVF